ncbi:MAG: aldehyde dehydrogenase [Planctomycetes bacterium]|nr:aldehyde dehydrogenase [Planctomycetota bacterium]
MDRRAVVARLLADRGETLLVTGLGASTWDATAAGDDARNFYLWGGMGGALATGLGLALAQPRRRVLVLTGDGEMLMGVGSLATVAVQKPRNLAVVVLDNERYGETGGQVTHTAHGVDLASMAIAAGFPSAYQVADRQGLDDVIGPVFREPGPLMVVIKVAPEQAPLVAPPRDGALLKDRFRGSLDVTRAARRGKTG